MKNETQDHPSFPGGSSTAEKVHPCPALPGPQRSPNPRPLNKELRDPESPPTPPAEPRPPLPGMLCPEGPGNQGSRSRNSR